MNVDNEINIDNVCEISWKCADVARFYNAGSYGKELLSKMCYYRISN